MRIVITDCDHPSVEEEKAVAAGRGISLELRQCRTEAEVVAACAEADGILVQYAPITDNVLGQLPRLRAVGRYGVGYDTVDVRAATRRGVAVSNVPDYGTEDVSDHAVALALSLDRGVVQFDRRVRRGNSDFAEMRPLHRLSTRTFGIVGLGLIGSATARKALGVGYNVIAHDPRLSGVGAEHQGVSLVTMHELLARADVVSLHVPLDASTRHLIDAEALARLKAGAVLVNTCRGGVVDTGAVHAALRSGQLKAAALDVLESEPLPADDPLLELDNLILTPHVAWYSEEAYSELKTRTAENVADVLEGLPPRNILNPEVLSSVTAPWGGERT